MYFLHFPSPQPCRWRLSFVQSYDVSEHRIYGCHMKKRSLWFIKDPCVHDFSIFLGELSYVIYHVQQRNIFLRLIRSRSIIPVSFSLSHSPRSKVLSYTLSLLKLSVTSKVNRSSGDLDGGAAGDLTESSAAFFRFCSLQRSASQKSIFVAVITSSIVCFIQIFASQG